jgi:signal transduction histidine kinase
VFGALAVLLAVVIVNRVRAAAARRERELARLRTEFVASASHELRTPLAQIQLFSEMLRNGSLPHAADIDRALRVIASESQRLAALVDNLLNFASLRRSVENRENEVCDIAEVAAQVIADFTPFARERGTRLAARLEGPVMARIGPEAFRQVLINYLDNALKYGPAGQTIGVHVWQTARAAGLSVEDQGEGIPPAERERVWQAFYRNEKASASGLAGSGIGLAVVRDLVLQCGGSTRVEDGREGGARFVAELRRAPGDDHPQGRER